MAKLKYLIVSNFRGASIKLRLDFEESKPITVIFGENGTGKSTITDALEAMGNGTAGSLTDRSSTKAKDHLPTIGKKSKDIHIELKAGGKIWIATIGKDGIPTGADPRPKIRVLRRTPLLQMVNAAPADRYEALKRFIDVQSVERSEAALKDAVTRAERNRDDLVARRTQAESQLTDVWTKESSPAPGMVAWAAGLASADATALQAKARTMREASTSIQNAEQRLADYDLALQTFSAKQQEVAKVEEEVVLLPAADSNKVMALTELLGMASGFLASWGKEDKCPVCEQGIPLEMLKSDIQTRLKEFAPYEAARIKRDTAVKAVQSEEQVMAPQREQLLRAARPLVACLGKVNLGPIHALKLDPSRFAELLKSEGAEPHLALQQARVLVGFLIPTRVSLDAAAEVESRNAAQIATVGSLQKTYLESIKDSESSQKSLEALKGALDIVRKTRISYTQAILDDVSCECNRLYSKVHPDERVAITKLELDPDRRASLNQKADFEGHHDVTPQAYFSESHLDTLAFCFWLALTKREFPNKDAVIVLDDVFTSVDAEHLERIADLLVDESRHFAQVLLATHQRRWRDHFKSPNSAGRFVQLTQLERWSLEKGIRPYTTKLTVDDLMDSLVAVPFERQGAASKAGILLETILEGLGRRYRCAVPWNAHGGYNLNELMDGTSSLFKTLEIHRPELDGEGHPVNPIHYIPTKPREQFEGIRAHAFIRNSVGAHHNPYGADLSDVEVETFVKQAIEFAKELSCPSCGQIPSRKTGTYYSCSCPPGREMRMLPLSS